MSPVLQGLAAEERKRERRRSGIGMQEPVLLGRQRTSAGLSRLCGALS